MCASWCGASGKGDGPAEASVYPKPKDLSDKRYVNRLEDDYLKELSKESGQVGPHLTAGGTKPRRNLEWHVKHFRNPPAVVPGSVMPPLTDLTEDDLKALADSMLSPKQCPALVAGWSPCGGLFPRHGPQKQERREARPGIARNRDGSRPRVHHGKKEDAG